jgi:hypothetical protein
MCLIKALERSHWRGGRCACYASFVMHYHRTPISIELLLATVTPLNMIEIP